MKLLMVRLHMVETLLSWSDSMWRGLQKMSVRDEGHTQMLQHEYADSVREAIVSDAAEVQARPSFYALVIHSNWVRRIF